MKTSTPTKAALRTKRSLAAHKANWTRKLARANAPAAAPQTRWVIVTTAGEHAARLAAHAEIQAMPPRDLALHHYRLADDELHQSEHLLRDYSDEHSPFTPREAAEADAMLVRVSRRLELIRGILRDAMGGGVS